MKVDLDKIDQKIIDLLIQDARMAISDLAPLVGLSRPAVAERIEKLQKQGVLRGYTAVVDHFVVQNPVIAFVAARHRGLLTSKVEGAIYELSKRPEILEIHGVAGEDCLYLKVRVHDMKELNDLVRELQEQPLNMETRTTIAMNTYFEKVGGILLSAKNTKEKLR